MIAPWGAANARKNPYVVAPSGVEGTRILLGSDAVDVLGSMRIALAGVGGIGREVLRLLALVGFGKNGGKLDAVDACDVFEHDLARGSLLRAGDVGTNKAASSVASVAQLCAARVNHARLECGSPWRGRRVPPRPTMRSVLPAAWSSRRCELGSRRTTSAAAANREATRGLPTWHGSGSRATMERGGTMRHF
jgi:hypothetical protein